MDEKQGLMERHGLTLVIVGLGAWWLFSDGKLPSFNGGEASPHYPKDYSEIRKAGGFWKLSLEEQAGVRDQCVEELQLLLEQVNDRMRFAQQGNNLSAIYVYRQMIQRLMISIRRAQNPACDPTAEQSVIAYMTAALSR